MKNIAEAIYTIGATSSRNSKIALVEQCANIVGFKEILQFIFNPYIRTGIAAAKLKKNLELINVPIHWQDYINHFVANQTGSDADVALAKSFIAQQETDAARSLATAMATKTLKIGITETTLNKVFGDAFIPKIGIMRGEHYKDAKGKVKGPFIVTEKLDGARRLIVKENGKVTMYTRSGHLDEGLLDIEEEAKHLPDNCVYDTEVLAKGEFENALALRQASASITNSKGPRRGATAHVFDMVPVEDFKKGISTHNAITRKALVAALFHDHKSLRNVGINDSVEFCEQFGGKHVFKHIRPVPIIGYVHTEEEIMELAKPIWDRGFEGVMLNTIDGKYEISATPRRQLLKVKATEEYVLKCIGVYEGAPGTKYVGMLGGVLLDYKGHRVGCGSGLNDEQRVKYWNDPSLIVGKMIEIDSFGESTNQGGGVSLNSPIFKRIVGEDS